MKPQRPLQPGFLKKFDQHLLLNHPGIWSTRVHLVLYYGLLFLALLTLLCFLEPVDPRAETTSPLWIGFVSIISVIGLTVWIIYLLRFNVFKKYGSIHPMHMLVHFLLYFVCVGIIVSFTYVHPVVESIRANMAYGDEEIVEDINQINFKIGQLEYKNLQQDWEYDSVALDKDLPLTTGEVYTDYPEQTKRNKIPFIRLDSSMFFSRLNNTDSVVKVNDTLSLMYRTPTFTFLNSYYIDSYGSRKIATSFEVYHYIISHLPNEDQRRQVNKELTALLGKYDLTKPAQRDPELAPANAFERILWKYNLRRIERFVDNVVDKKYRWDRRHFDVYMRVFYYCTLAITLLLFVFRHSTVRTFFLTLLTAVLLAILTAVISAFFGIDELGGLSLGIVYILLFFLASLATWRSKKRYAVSGIMINLFVVMIILLPTFLLAWRYEWLQQRFRRDLIPEYPQLQNWEILTAEASGALLLLVLLATYIYRVYRRWYALPEN